MNGEIPQDRTGTGELDPARRAAFAQELLRALAAYCPGSRAELRGSLALGTADAYSDIDIAWTVPDDRFDACLDAVPEVLGAVVPLDSSVRTPIRGTPVSGGCSSPPSAGFRSSGVWIWRSRGARIRRSRQHRTPAGPAPTGAIRRRTATTGRGRRVRWPTRLPRRRPYCAGSRRMPGGCWSAASGASTRRTTCPGGGAPTSAGSPKRRPGANRTCAPSPTGC